MQSVVIRHSGDYRRNKSVTDYNMRNKDIAKEQTLMNTALRMISETGLAGIKMNDLAKQAGVATGTFYIYFSSKEDMIQKLYHHICCQIGVDLMKDVPETLPLKERIRLICRNYTLELINRPEYKIFMDQYFCSPYFQHEADISALETAIYLDPVLVLIREAGNTSDEINSTLSPELLVQLSRGALNNYAEYLVSKKRAWDEDEFNHVFYFIWNGAKKASARVAKHYLS